MQRLSLVLASSVALAVSAAPLDVVDDIIASSTALIVLSAAAAVLIVVAGIVYCTRCKKSRNHRV